MQEDTNIRFILKAVAGSRSHGLATEDSDTDLHGVFAVRSEAFWSLTRVRESIVREKPDESYHELGKFVHLALKCAPNSLELLWGDSLEEEPVWGQQLKDIRHSFLSARAVKGAYLGYASAQMHRMQNRTAFDSPKRAKLLKHAFRLVDQGLELYTTGEMRVEVAPERRSFYLTLGDRSDEDLLAMYEERLALWAEFTSALPESPKVGPIESYLMRYRLAHLHDGW